MNIGGKDRWHSKYVCDKCKKEIHYIAFEGIPVNKYYKTVKKAGTINKKFNK